MRKPILTEIERIAGDRLTPAMREEIADCVIKIIEEKKRADAFVVIDAVKDSIKKNGGP